MTDPTAPSRRARGGADARRAARTANTSQAGFIRRKVKPLVSRSAEDQIGLIMANAERILEEIGIDFRDDAEALQMWKDAGADVKGERVRFPGLGVRPAQDRAGDLHPACTHHRPNAVQIDADATLLRRSMARPFVSERKAGGAMPPSRTSAIS